MVIRNVTVDLPDKEYGRELYRCFNPYIVVTINGKGIIAITHKDVHMKEILVLEQSQPSSSTPVPKDL